MDTNQIGLKEHEGACDIDIFIWSSLQVSVEDRRAILIEKFIPSMDKLRSRISIAGWALAPRSFPNKENNSFSYDLIMRSSKSWKEREITQVDSFFQECGLQVAKLKAQEVATFSLEIVRRMRKRHGSDLTWTLAFQELSTSLFLKFLKSSPMWPINGEMVGLCLANLIFLIRCFGLSPEEINEGSQWWVKFVCEKNKILGPKYDSFLRERSQVASDLIERSGIQYFLTAFLKGEDKIFEILRPFAKECRNIGSGLKAAKTFSEEFPYVRAVWNNFIHMHMLQLGVDNASEILMHLILTKYLKNNYEAFYQCSF